VTATRVAVTGAGGRLGRALAEAFRGTPAVGPVGTFAWSRPEYDLDDLAAAARLVERDRPDAVVHAAAWTDVDGCARDPDLALRRNGEATAALARACAGRGIDLVVVSTNEVFDGLRADGRGYLPGDEPAPGNPYGSSKLAGERSAALAYAEVAAATTGAGTARTLGRLGIVRTAWLYGPPGNDFPTKIIAAAARAAAAGEPLRLVDDEFGSPTSAADLARAIVALITAGVVGGTRHLVNAGAVSRADWGRQILRIAGVSVPIEEVPASTWTRASSPPRWGVLEPSPLPSGEMMRRWDSALADDGPRLRHEAASVIAARVGG
jgi:dTDP-4-dehydrorhamnose reductase